MYLCMSEDREDGFTLDLGLALIFPKVGYILIISVKIFIISFALGNHHYN